MAALAVVFGYPLLTRAVSGASMSSDNYRVLDSNQMIFGGIASSSSSNFILTAALGNFAIGTSSFNTFTLRSGFLYYPKVVAPVLSTATAGNSQVALTWTAAMGYQGWNINGYNLCHKTTGDYTCENVNNVTYSVKSSLNNGTTYTFKIEAKDGVGNVIAVSNELSAVPVAPTTPPSSSGGGGGGGGYVPPASTGLVGSVSIIGIAYPESTVSVYNDGVLASSVKASENAKFQIVLSNVVAGPHTIGLNSTDPNGRKSLTVTFTVNVMANTTVILSDLLLPPTIDISSAQLSPGDTLRIFGEAQPDSVVNIHVFSSEIINKTISDSEGSYELSFNTSPLAEDNHTTKSRAIVSKVATPFSQVLQFFIGKILSRGGTSDINNDSKVNIKDFSIMLYWWNTKSSAGLDKADLNHDSKVNIVDFSILLFQWTG